MLCSKLRERGWTYISIMVNLPNRLSTIITIKKFYQISSYLWNNKIRLGPNMPYIKNRQCSSKTLSYKTIIVNTYIWMLSGPPEFWNSIMYSKDVTFYFTLCNIINVRAFVRQWRYLSISQRLQVLSLKKGFIIFIIQLVFCTFQTN